MRHPYGHNRPSRSQQAPAACAANAASSLSHAVCFLRRALASGALPAQAAAGFSIIPPFSGRRRPRLRGLCPTICCCRSARPARTHNACRPAAGCCAACAVLASARRAASHCLLALVPAFGRPTHYPLAPHVLRGTGRLDCILSFCPDELAEATVAARHRCAAAGAPPPLTHTIMLSTYIRMRI